MFVTALVYIALRILFDTDKLSDIKSEWKSTLIDKSQAWINQAGGLKSIPNWGRVWLSILGLYKWDGVNPSLPELWILPKFLPIHPSKLYCHTRLIYLPIAILYRLKTQIKTDSLIKELRKELYLVSYNSIRFKENRNQIFKNDLFEKPNLFLRLSFAFLKKIEPIIPQKITQKSINKCYDHLKYELSTTDYCCISPVNGLLNLLAIWFNNPTDPLVKKIYNSLENWLWKDKKDGYRYTGARSNTWDTAFVIQSIRNINFNIKDSNLKSRIDQVMTKALSYFDSNQVLDELNNYKNYYRMPRKGGFCFSRVRHSWPVSDCTAEALVSLEIIDSQINKKLSNERVHWMVDFILNRQNKDGGFGSYEVRREYLIMNKLNPTELYGNCMTELSYVECTSSCIHSLMSYIKMTKSQADHNEFLNVKHIEIRKSIEKAKQFLIESQNTDGSWNGFWGVNFTYGTYFGILGLIQAGIHKEDKEIKQAVYWLKQNQLSDNGWGETWYSAVIEKYQPSERSQVEQTSWALLGIMQGEGASSQEVKTGIKFLVDQQLNNGNWPESKTNGVFFNTAMLYYDMYRSYYPLNALNLYYKLIYSN